MDVDAIGVPLQRGNRVGLSRPAAGSGGGFSMTPAPESQPNSTKRLVAVSLADQVGAALAGYQPGRG